MAKKSKRKTTSKRSASSRQRAKTARSRAKPKGATKTLPHTPATSGTHGKKATKPATKAASTKKATRGQRAPQMPKPAAPAPPDSPASPASKDKRTGVLEAAVRVLKAAKKPMRCRQIVEVALTKNYWKTTGKTPAATLSSAMLREIQTKGKDSRFRKVERGLFALKAARK